MKHSTLTMFLFAVYLTCLSICFTFFPDAVVSRFGFQGTHEVWIRILGYMQGALAFCCAMAIREEATHFYRWTAYGRAPSILLWTLFVIAGAAPPASLAFGIIETGSGIWTALALRREELHHVRELGRL